MSINWVMLSEDGFTPLPGESTLYKSPNRTTLSLQSLNKHPGTQPYSIYSGAGTVHLTNRRIVYLPATPTSTLQSFAAPILNLHDTHVTAPFFGPNVWTALLQPVAGGGIPPAHAALELKMTFKDGGAFDFHNIFERIKERLQQAVEVARESGYGAGDGSESGGGRGVGGLAGVDLGNVHLDQLPAYEESARGSVPLSEGPSTAPTSPQVAGSLQSSPKLGNQRSPRQQQEAFSPPAEPPPGYEEVQRESVADEVERRLRRSASQS